MDYVIRRLTQQDAALFEALWLKALKAHPEAFTSDYESVSATPLAQTEHWLAMSYAWGAFAGDVLHGFVLVNPQAEWKRRHMAVLGPVYASPEMRGQGMTRKLMQHALKEMPPAIEQVMLSTGTGNVPAQKLYRDLGFAPWGVQARALKLEDGQYVDEEWFMWMRP